MLDPQGISASAPPVVAATNGQNPPGAGGTRIHFNGRRLPSLAIIPAVLAAACAVAWASYLRPINLQVSQAERDVPVEVFGLGTVEARIASKVGFKVSGVLVDLRADVGDRVTKDSVLGRLDDREQSARVARTRASIVQAEANLQRAAASVEKARANYNNAKRISERRQTLVQSNSTSVEAAETAYCGDSALN